MFGVSMEDLCNRDRPPHGDSRLFGFDFCYCFSLLRIAERSIVKDSDFCHIVVYTLESDNLSHIH